jgi:hypothetical protein
MIQSKVILTPDAILSKISAFDVFCDVYATQKGM